MIWNEDWWLCSGRACDRETIATRQDQATMLRSLRAARPDPMRTQGVRSLLLRLEGGKDPRWLSDVQVMQEVDMLCRTGRLHLHLRPRKYSVAGGSSDADSLTSSARNQSRNAQSGQPTRSPSKVDWDTWIEIKLTDEDQHPMPGMRYQIKLPDKTIKEGRLDQNGEAHVASIKAGQCEIRFPEIDGREWRPA